MPRLQLMNIGTQYPDHTEVVTDTEEWDEEEPDPIDVSFNPIFKYQQKP